MEKERDLISVIIPCYNAEEFIEEAISSIRNQSYKKLEIICIDDCSTDNTYEILKRLQSKDGRIILVKNIENLKLIKTLNKGIAIAKGKYIARMDADDVSLKSRLECQVKFLEENSKVSVVSSYFSYVTHLGNFHSKSYQILPCKSSYACTFMNFLYPPVLHPNTLIRAEILKKYLYSEVSEALHIEDYYLWSNMINNGEKIAVIPKYLFKYRRNRGSVSHLYRDIQDGNHVAMSVKNLQKAFNTSFSIDVVKILTNRNKEVSIKSLNEAIEVLHTLEKKYCEKFPNESLTEVEEVTNFVRQRTFDIMLYSLKVVKKIHYPKVLYKLLKFVISHPNDRFLFTLYTFKVQWLVGTIRTKIYG
jgi:glycosyltransferase involved in cell wall biosynthesis